MPPSIKARFGQRVQAGESARDDCCSQLAAPFERRPLPLLPLLLLRRLLSPTPRPVEAPAPSLALDSALMAGMVGSISQKIFLLFAKLLHPTNYTSSG